ncbi:ABC transporter permease [Syntrophorhabdus aromaticivorans]|jgi:ABC-2 type transport system permease protein|uniref:ABC transporter permease n=1 Tax=Syntrophorhabdus aromaticivorans TaxID=328301 RepID=A0A351U0V7_9BACT|nr:ABC transporter permease [Syntrophorhabdus aromaticivorans]NLW35073.1 ABC transporter permease [Syntrophorhabdus aromaticivorans]HBA53588.1 ABC transporter permease [Syntrophorhabdus aromaticivorans]
MFERIKQLVIKEFLYFFREKRTLFFLTVTPLIQILVFGYVATMDVNNVSTAYYDLDRSSESRELARRLESSGYFTIKRAPRFAGEIRELIDRGEVLCAIQVNRGFGRDLQKGIPTQIQVIVDGTDSNTALIAMSYVNGIIGKYGRDMMAPEIKACLLKTDFRTRVWYNPDLRSKNYMVPGVIALIVMITCLLLTSMSVVREREIGTMEQLMVTPIRPVELMLGKTIPAAAVGFFDMALVTVFGILLFEVPVKGALLLLVLCTGAYLLSVLGIGLFISTVSKTQQQAMMATFLFFQPAILLSGFATPIETMPPIFQYMTYLSPLRYFLVIVRGIFLKGVGIEVLWPQIVALLVLGVAILAASALRFKKRLT